MHLVVSVFLRVWHSWFIWVLHLAHGQSLYFFKMQRYWLLWTEWLRWTASCLLWISYLKIAHSLSELFHSSKSRAFNRWHWLFKEVWGDYSCLDSLYDCWWECDGKPSWRVDEVEKYPWIQLRCPAQYLFCACQCIPNSSHFCEFCFWQRQEGEWRDTFFHIVILLYSINFCQLLVTYF